jgi:hypothetical protein
MALTKITQGVIKPNENYDTHNINSTGIVTATSFVGNLTGNVTGNLTGTVSGDATGLTGTPNLNVGIVTATAFHGDGSNLTGVSGFADAQGRDCGLQHVFTTPITLTLGGPGCGIKTITATAAQGNLAFIRAKNLTIATGSTIHVSAGTTIKTNVLNLF